MRFEQHKHGEKNNKFTDLYFFIRSLLIGYFKQHRTTDFRIRLIRDERENIFNCTRLRFEQHKHGEKNNKFTDLYFFIRSLLRQTKEFENC